MMYLKYNGIDRAFDFDFIVGLTRTIYNVPLHLPTHLDHPIYVGECNALNC